jgi:hypothetical protein
MNHRKSKPAATKTKVNRNENQAGRNKNQTRRIENQIGSLPRILQFKQLKSAVEPLSPSLSVPPSRRAATARSG